MNEDDGRDRTVQLTQDFIYQILLEEQLKTPELFNGPITSLTIVLVDNKANLTFVPQVNPGNANPHFLSRLGLMFSELKRFMVDKDYGAWFSATLHIDNETASYFFTFNYTDHEELFIPFSTEQFQKELDLFPRENRYIPDWLKLITGTYDDTNSTTNTPNTTNSADTTGGAGTPADNSNPVWNIDSLPNDQTGLPHS